MENRVEKDSGKSESDTTLPSKYFHSCEPQKYIHIEETRSIMEKRLATESGYIESDTILPSKILTKV